MARIAVEENLADIRAALQQKGYDIVTLRNEKDAEGCDCCVISGQDKDTMGMSTVSTQGSVINAHGCTADDVCRQVEQKFQ
jgi:hypothetical protein